MLRRAKELNLHRDIADLFSKQVQRASICLLSNCYLVWEAGLTSFFLLCLIVNQIQVNLIWLFRLRDRIRTCNLSLPKRVNSHCYSPSFAEGVRIELTRPIKAQQFSRLLQSPIWLPFRFFVDVVRIELTTSALKAPCSTN